MDEKPLPVVPSSWEEGSGVVEKKNDITYYKQYINKSNLIYRYHPLPLLPEGGDYKTTPFSFLPPLFCFSIILFTDFMATRGFKC